MLAARFAGRFMLPSIGHTIGLLHDLGKYAAAFQARLRGSGEQVDHATPGAWAARQILGEEMGMLLAYGIAGHHAGLPDGGEGDGTLLKRLDHVERRPPAGLEAWKAAGLPLAPAAMLRPEYRRFGADLSEDTYRYAFLARMLFSCLTDADFLATAHFYDRGTTRLRRYEKTKNGMARLAAVLQDHMAGLGDGGAAQHIGDWRRRILAACRDSAKSPPGVFTLDVPTGGGKTLASLSFALDHAAANGLDRVIYAIPYTSIIEQTADVFRKALASAGEDIVLEHHSAAEVPARGVEGIGPARLHLATENWDAPVVVTTTVQLFDSLYADRPSRCRKLHNLARSVIVLDEAQALPIERMSACLAALKALVTDYGATLVLCSATLPGFDRIEGLRVRLPTATALIPAEMTAAMTQAFRRATVVDLGILDDTALAERVAQETQILCIVDSRAHAQEVFGLLPADDSSRFHLSAAMCPAHRRDTLAKVKARLAAGLPCRLISTRVIEAGVDISFPKVWRAVAGVDSIAQAAGRCNRHGEGAHLGEVGIFRPARADAIPRNLVDLRRRASLGMEVLAYHTDPLTPAAIGTYFERLFGLNSGQDKDNCWRDLARAPGIDCLPFRTVAANFQMIEDGGDPVIVPYGESEALIAELARALASPVQPRRLPLNLLRRLQAFTVSVHGREGLVKSGSAVAVDPANDIEGRFVRLITGPVYDADLGLRPGMAGVRDAGNNLF